MELMEPSTSSTPMTADNAEHSSEMKLKSPSDKSSILARLTIADGLYLLVVVGAALLRFTNLGSISLSPAEASQALTVWQLSQPIHTIITIESPAYFSLTAVLVAFLGSSDAVMRLIPALFGLGLVLLPWLLRDRLGKIGALAAAGLLAVSPLLAAVSRTAGGEAIALFALLLAAVAGLQMASSRSSNWLYVLAIALGLGLSSAPLIYSGLLTLVIARWSQHKIAPPQSPTTWPERSQLIKATVVGLAVLIALCTRFFTFPAGIGAAAQLFGDWLTQFNLLGGPQELIEPFLVLARYEVVLLSLGIVAMLWAIWRNQPLGTMLTYWLMAALILLLLQRGVLDNVLIIPLAGYLLLGLATNHLLWHSSSRWTWAVTGIVLLLGAIILANLSRFLRVSFADNQQILNLWMALFTVALAMLAFYFFWATHGRAILQGSWLGILILVLLYQWGTAWQLTHNSANDPRERWVQEAADDELPVLLNTIEKISQTATNSNIDLELYSTVDSPVLHWYLRDYWQAQYGQSLPPGAQYEVIISLADIEEPVFGSDYLGSDFGLLRTGTAQAPLSSTPGTDILRWWLFHESTTPLVEERVILWVRSDLAYSE